LSDLQYELPPELIAQHPVEPRDAARLLVLDRASGRIEHCVFRDVGDYLAPGDALVINDTRVLPARFFGRRETGGQVEGLFLRTEGDGWRVMLKSRGRLRIGQRLTCSGAEVSLTLVERGDRGEWLVRPEPAVGPFEWLAQIGRTPLPPYIHRSVGGSGDTEPGDAERYQTVYARQPGAVAAPTAGLHFTADLLAGLTRRGIATARVTLHVGPGTFVPIETDDLGEHRMHAEWFEARSAELARLQTARAAGGRIVAVGTTSVRVLESLPEGVVPSGTGSPPVAAAGETPVPPSDSEVHRTRRCVGLGGPTLRADAAVPPEQSDSQSSAWCHSGWTRIFIYPPYRFRRVDRLITNFHLPGSTLLALVMAFATPDLIRAAYAAAIAARYRFYSYGDAMLIL
jgi:S-adenosylmethionine:tRNA ribosyltransferase-isomerase